MDNRMMLEKSKMFMLIKVSLNKTVSLKTVEQFLLKNLLTLKQMQRRSKVLN